MDSRELDLSKPSTEEYLKEERNESRNQTSTCTFIDLDSILSDRSMKIIEKTA